MVPFTLPKSSPLGGPFSDRSAVTPSSPMSDITVAASIPLSPTAPSQPATQHTPWRTSPTPSFFDYPEVQPVIAWFFDTWDALCPTFNPPPALLIFSSLMSPIPDSPGPTLPLL